MHNQPHTLRILGGKWRSRKVVFSDTGAVRPTIGRIRETLFNWLQGSILGARCIDLFAGSGILSFEALSRGAAHVTCIDKDSGVVEAIKQTQHLLGVSPESIQVHLGSVLESKQFIDVQPYDIVFVDPPFHQEYAAFLLPWIQQNIPMHKASMVYVEQFISESWTLPAGWSYVKCKATQHIRYGVVQRG